jgi:CRISPR-associated endoribonuclease Cas6
MTHTLTAYQMFFDLEARDPLRLHAHNGSALRGMLYNAVRTLTDDPARNPALQFAPEQPLHQRLLATLDDADPRGRDTPRPYVIDPPEMTGCERTLRPGDTFSFGVTLFGDVISAFPILVMALRAAEAMGLGREIDGGGGRGRFRVAHAVAQNPFTEVSQPLITAENRVVRTPQVQISDEDIHTQAAYDIANDTGLLRLHFITPMSLKSQGDALRRPVFSVLIHRLIERLTRLSEAYGTGLPSWLPTDRDGRNVLLRKADAVRVLGDHTHWVDLRGHSDRTRAATNLSGLAGTVDVVSETGFGPFFSLLRWGEVIHAGSNAVKGNGLLRIQPLAGDM